MLILRTVKSTFEKGALQNIAFDHNWTSGKTAIQNTVYDF